VITLTQEGAARQTYTFSGRSISIGRKEGNDIVLSASHISSRHAAIHHRDGQYVISDLGSTNGSVVVRGDRRMILGPRGYPELVLRSGDLLLLGDIDRPVRMRVDISEPRAAQGTQNTVVATRARAQTGELKLRLAGDHAALRALYQMVEALHGVADRGELLRRVTDTALRAIPGAVDVLLVLREEGKLAVTAEAHRGEGLCREPNLKICEQVLAGDKAILFGQHDESVLPAHTLVSQGVGSGIAAPLWQDGRVLGMLRAGTS